MSRAPSASIRSLRPDPSTSAPPAAVVRAVTIVGVDAGARVLVRGEDGHTAEAILALAVPYLPAVGDRVVAAGAGETLYVIGVIQTANPPSLPIPGGGSVQVKGSAVELRDHEGHLLVRYADGSAEIAAPTGDVTLAAPSGRVVLRSGLDVSIEAARDVTQHAARSVRIGAGADPSAPQLRVGAEATSLDARRLEVRTREAALETERGTVVARELATTAAAIVQKVERFELVAGRIVEKTREALRDVSGLAQLRAGRVRTLVEEAYSHYARSTTIVSAEETTIDGERINLG